MVRDTTIIMDEIRQTQKKLTRAKGRRDQSSINYLQARIKLLQDEMSKAE